MEYIANLWQPLCALNMRTYLAYELRRRRGHGPLLIGCHGNQPSTYRGKVGELLFIFEMVLLFAPTLPKVEHC